ncbi:unnamed protein product [Sphagnum jensenii]|uniref:Uncharacterized protein n=1 Tax=Sphagnum jensenii TaxID=128206 RepID=A0ABP1AER6_9BRYO
MAQFSGGIPVWIQVNPGTHFYDLSFSKYNDVAWPAVIGSTSVEISLLASCGDNTDDGQVTRLFLAWKLEVAVENSVNVRKRHNVPLFCAPLDIGIVIKHPDVPLAPALESSIDESRCWRQLVLGGSDSNQILVSLSWPMSTGEVSGLHQVMHITFKFQLQVEK